MMLCYIVDGIGSQSAGMGPREGAGGDADVSAPSSVASERQQGLSFPFCHWLAALTKSHVVQAGTNKIKTMLLS